MIVDKKSCSFKFFIPEASRWKQRLTIHSIAVASSLQLSEVCSLSITVFSKFWLTKNKCVIVIARPVATQITKA